MSRPLLALILVPVMLTACPNAPVAPRVDAEAVDAPSSSDAADVAPEIAVPAEITCDPLVPSVCALPWPNSHFLTPDPSKSTGYRVNLQPTTLPANRDGIHVNPARLGLMDGFSVGGAFVVHFPTLDPASVPDEEAVAESLGDGSPLLLFEVGGEGAAMKRLPLWGEVDVREEDEERRALFLRPATLLSEGRRYIVAIRNIVARDGAPIAPSEAFAALRDGTSAGTNVASRQPAFDALFELLEQQGIARSELVLAWDFVTASCTSIHGDALKVRQGAFAHVDVNGVPFSIDSISDEEGEHIAFEVQGTFEVADFQRDYAFQHVVWSVFQRDADEEVEQTGTRQAEFRVRVPWSALDGTPHGVLMHGHGLNGTHRQIRAGFYDALANSENLIVVGANMIGMSSDDVGKISTMIYNLSHFHALSERVTQALVEHLVLMRGMRDYFDDVPEIMARGLVIDPDHLYYSGISQGGIYGASIMALSQDMTRGHLGVPGNNYSLLLLRSVDFDPFLLGLSLTYPSALDRALLLSVIQGLWDSADSAGYYRHLSVDPFPETPSHSVLLASATGDYQVALVSNEVATRSDVGVALMPDYGKHVPLVEPTPYPHVGSALVNYSFGNPWPAPGAVPPKDELGDPHGKPRKLQWHNDQMMHFFRTGEVIDVCGGDGCTPD